MPKELDAQKLGDESFKHVVQDVLILYTFLFTTTKLRIEKLHFHPEDDVMPLIQKALEMCYSQNPYKASSRGQHEDQES